MCADNTPLRTSPLLEEFDYTGNTITGDEVTAGTYIPFPNTDKHTKLFLERMKRPDHVPETIVKDIFTTKYYVMR